MDLRSQVLGSFFVLHQLTRAATETPRNLHSLPVDEVDGRTSLFDPEESDFDRFPDARKAQAEPGTMGWNFDHLAHLFQLKAVTIATNLKKTWNRNRNITELKTETCFQVPKLPGNTELHRSSVFLLTQAYSVVVEEGETVVLPARWWHWAKSLTPSITLMRSFAAVCWWFKFSTF